MPSAKTSVTQSLSQEHVIHDLFLDQTHVVVASVANPYILQLRHEADPFAWLTCGGSSDHGSCPGLFRCFTTWLLFPDIQAQEGCLGVPAHVEHSQVLVVLAQCTNTGDLVQLDIFVPDESKASPRF